MVTTSNWILFYFLLFIINIFRWLFCERACPVVTFVNWTVRNLTPRLNKRLHGTRLFPVPQNIFRCLPPIKEPLRLASYNTYTELHVDYVSTIKCVVCLATTQDSRKWSREGVPSRSHSGWNRKRLHCSSDHRTFEGLSALGLRQSKILRVKAN